MNDRMVVVMRLPVSVTAAEVVAALKAIGATAVDVYAARKEPLS